MNTPPVRSPRDRLDRLVAIGARVLRFWWVAVIVVALGGGLSLLAATMKQRQYRSETVLLYREGIRATYVLGRDAEQEQTRKLGLRLKEMVLARPRLQQIIDELGLYKDMLEKRGPVQAIDEMRKHIDFRVREGDTFLLAYSDKDPETARKVTEKLAQSLIDENSRYRSKQAEATREFMAAEKTRIEKELRDKETMLAAFLTEHPVFAHEDLGAGGAAVRAAQVEKQKKTSGENSELNALEREAARIRQRLAMPTDRSRPAPPPEVRRDPRLERAKTQAENELLEARRDLDEKRASLTDQHPDVIAAKTRLRSAEQRLKQAQDAATAGEIISPIEAPPATESEKPALEARLKSVEREIAEARRRKSAGGGAPTTTGGGGIVKQIVDLETEWARLNREVAEARERYQAVDSREFVARMAASSEESGQAATVDIVDPAFLPTRPAGGGRMKLMIMGLAVSMALAFAIVVGCAVFDDRLYDRSDVESLDLAPLLVSVPRSKGAKGRSAIRG